MIFHKSHVFSLIAALLISPCQLTAAHYERISSIRIVELQTTYEEILAHRHKKRVIAASSISAVTAAGIAWFLYNWLKPDDVTIQAAPTATVSQGQLRAAKLRMYQYQETKDKKKQPSFKKIAMSKFQEGIAFGIAGAFVSFILSRSNDVFTKLEPLLDNILPMGDMPLLITALRRAVVSSRHYEDTMQLLLEHPTKPGSLASEIVENNMQLAHRQIIMSQEQLAAWLACFADDMGTIGYQDVQQTLGSLVLITSKIADHYAATEKPSDEILELTRALRIQTEQIVSLVLPVLQEFGYEQI